MLPPVPQRSLEELKHSAQLFLEQHHPSGETPVPIKAIVELDMGLEIRPIRALRSRFGIDGYLSTDLRTIVVDESLVTRYVNRYRFTLAHEIGHLVLHSEQIHALAQTSPTEWKAAAQAIDPPSYSRMEFQAFEFAGCVLVPRQPLLELYQQAGRLAEQHGIDLGELQDASLDYVAGWIARRFEVSTEVVERLRREGITP